MMDVSWTIGTSPDGAVTAERLLGGMPTYTRGQTITLQFGFQQANYETLREYLDFVHTPSTTTSLSGTAYYRPNHTDPESLLMSFDPSGSSIPASVTGLWGVLVGGSDETDHTLSNNQISLQVFVLAELAEYADRTAVETAHKL